MISATLGATLLEVDWTAGQLKTTLPGGRVVYATPQSDAHYAEVARELGYGDNLAAMAIDNDALHSWVCNQAGQQYCPVLWGTATRNWWPWWQEEDNAVLAIQALVQGRREEDLLEYRRVAIEQYVYWIRPRTSVPEIVSRAKRFLDLLRRAD